MGCRETEKKKKNCSKGYKNRDDPFKVQMKGMKEKVFLVELKQFIMSVTKGTSE